jgi:hypothetical protein
MCCFTAFGLDFRPETLVLFHFAKQHQNHDVHLYGLNSLCCPVSLGMYTKGGLENLSLIWRLATYILDLGCVTADHVTLELPHLYRAQ